MSYIKSKKVVLILSLLIYLWVFILYNLGNSVMPLFLKNSPYGTSIFGMLTASMFIGQFLISPFWGILTDKKGKYIIALSPLGYGFGQLLYILSQSNFILLILSRVISGIFAILFLGQFISFISDNCQKKERRLFLSFAAIMTPLGMGISYLIGGMIKGGLCDFAIVYTRDFLNIFFSEEFSKQLTLCYTFPFTIQFFLSILTSFVLYFFIKNNSLKPTSNNIPDKILIKNRKIFPFIRDIKKIRKSSIGTCLIISFFNSMAYVSIQSMQYYLQDNKGLDPLQIGNVVFLYSIISVFLSFSFQNIIFKKLSNYQNLLLSNLSVVFLSLLMIYLPLDILIIAVSFIIMMQTLLTSVIQEILVDSSNNNRGYLLGINQSLISLGSILGNFNLGIFYSYKPEIFNYNLQFIFMSFFLFIITFLLIFKLNIHKDNN